jgi:hypothetical protein
MPVTNERQGNHGGGTAVRSNSHHSAVRTTPLVDDGGAAVDQRGTGTAREDALLFLRSAVRHTTQGPPQPGHRLRAVGGLSVQSRHALSEGRQTVPAGVPSRSADDRAGTGSIGWRRVQIGAIRGGGFASRLRDRPHSADTWGGRHRCSGRRKPDDREDVPARQVRARLPQDAVHRLQRPPVHGERRRREQEGVRHRSHDEPVVGHGGHRRDLGRRLERGRMLAHHDQLHLAGARAGCEDHRPGSPHHAGRADLRFVSAGQARPGRGPLRRGPADHDRARLARSRLHRRAYGGFRRGRRVLPSVDACARRRSPVCRSGP